MAVQFASGNALSAKRWSAVLYKETMRDMFFAKYTGAGSSNVIQTDMELTKKASDRMTFGLRMRMTGAGQESANGITLQGNEEDLVFYDFSVNLVIAGHSTKSKSELDEQRTAFTYRKELKDALKEWSIEKLESKIITALSTDPTSSRGINVQTGQPESGEVMSTALLDQAKRLARLWQSGLPKVRPATRQAGQDWYIVLLHDYQMKALRAEDAWIKAQREANISGIKNPIFSGAAGHWNKMILEEYERCEISTTNLEARALLLGAQSAVIAYGHPFKWWEDLLDGNRLPWVGTTVIWGVAKTVFNSQDFGLVTIDTAYEADSN